MAAPQAQTRRQAIARQIIYLLVAASVIMPYIVPIPLPINPSPVARQLYERVEELKPGSPVLYSFDYDPSAMAELYPMSLALLRQAFARGLHPIVMTHWPNGVGLAKQLVEEAAAEYDRKPGLDYVFLGFKPGGSNLVLNMGENLKRAFDKDYFGQPTESMPALRGVNSLREIPVVVDLAAGATVEMWIAYGRDRFHFDLGAGVTAVIAPDLYPFLQSKQLVGLLGGLRGAADYEVLIGHPGSAAKGMQAQSMTHMLIILLILGANVHFFYIRRRRHRS